MNVFKPFIVEPHTTATNSYIPYNIFNVYKVWNSQTQQAEPRGNLIYTGRTWIDADGNGKVNVSEVLKDYVYTPQIDFNQYTQRYRLSEAGARTLTDLHPIEESGKIFNNFIYLRWNNTGSPYDYDAETTKPTIYKPFYNVPLNPYSNETGVIFYNSIGTDILPEIPYISTDSNYFGFVIGWDERFKQDKIILGNAAGLGNKIEKTLNNQWGNFFPLYTLSELYSVFTSPIDRLYITFVARGESHEVPMTKQVVKIDKTCLYDYYISWLTPWGGWQSQGLNNKHIKKSERIDHQTLTTLNGQKKEYKTDVDFTYSLTRTCKRDMAELLNTLTVSPCIWLYDVANDFGTPVLCKNTSIQTEPTTKLNTINLDFETVQHYNF